MPMPFDLIVGWWGVLLLHRQENRRKRSELRRCSYRELGAWWLCLAHNPYHVNLPARRWRGCLLVSNCATPSPRAPGYWISAAGKWRWLQPISRTGRRLPTTCQQGERYCKQPQTPHAPPAASSHPAYVKFYKALLHDFDLSRIDWNKKGR